MFHTDSSAVENAISLLHGEKAVLVKSTLQPGTTVEEMERQLILLTLEHTRDNKTHAAEVLGISSRPSTTR